ncbi:ATP-binding protein [Wenzhouxiangella sp. XN24]|uniref:ATP-binding protein n=1 Tax=Wenzhouxiangella sp. XN24 TaxID=2713569 RepID=UPI0013E9E0F8|nr:ATP-binding protein [Wenzhouxiangella sp. XN24]NGX17388.1 hypothetical protein [Wenzhouxiangella sp. XN24]
MAKGKRWEIPTRRWWVAAILAAVSMFGWLAWHATDAAATLDRLQAAHASAAQVHDSILQLQAEVRRTVQLALATGEEAWLVKHAEAESSLRDSIADLQAPGVADAGSLREASNALDALSRIEARAMALLAEGRQEAGLALVTGPEYDAGIAALYRAIRAFDDGRHDWLLSQSLGLTRHELVSLSGALLLFAAAITAWMFLISQLQREKAVLRREIEARGRAEEGLRRAQKMELLGQLAGTVAHDVDGILSAVAGYSALARRASDSAARWRALAGLDRAVRQGRGLTSNLLSLVRHEQAVRRPVELGALLRATEAWLAPLLPANIALQLCLARDGESWLEADPVSLQQALMNLALNARDAMPEGGILRLSLVDSGETADAPDSQQSRNACIVVSDTGRGMDAATLAMAREPLFSTKPEGSGTGLGLPSVERVVAAHGGRFELDSTPGEGTQARIYLPVPAGDAPPSTSHVVVQVLSTDAYTARLLADALKDKGFEVSIVDRWDSRSPGMSRAGLVLIDWRGEPGEALAALQDLRDTGVAKPVILLMDVGSPSSSAEFEDQLAGLAWVVSRSVPLGELAQLARRLVAGHEVGRAA